MPKATVIYVLRPYRLLAAVPYAPSLMFFSLLGRLHIAGIGIVMTFLIVDWTGSYAIGAVIGTTMTIGQAVAGPLRGRAADRSSPPKLLLVTGVLCGLGMVAIVVVAQVVDPARWWLILPVALLTGLAQPPISQVARAVWPKLIDGPAREAAYAVEATLQELLWVVGPVLAAFTVALWGAPMAMMVIATWAAIGSLLFAAALWRAGLRDAPSGNGGSGSSAPRSLFRVPGFVPLVAFMGLFIGGLASVDLALVGWARERGMPELAGLLVAVWSIGSLVGGLVLGASSAKPRLWLRALLSGLGFLALVPALPPLAEPGSPWLIGVILLVGGTAIAPTLAASNGRLADVAPAHQRSEAFGWSFSAMMAGAAIPAPLAGWMLDLWGPAAASAVAAVLGLLAVGFVVHHSVRASRGARVADQTAAA